MFHFTCHIFTTLFTTVMVVVQCIAPVAANCGCTGPNVERSPHGFCCSETPAESSSCCETSECNCGRQCGSGNSDCSCGCSDIPQKPEPVQESETPAESHVKVLADTGLNESVVDLLAAAETTAVARSHRAPSNAVDVQILLCTWQT